MKENKLYKYLIYIVLAAALVAFLAGILVGRNMATATATDISKFLKENELDSESYLIEQQMMSDLSGTGCVITKSKVDQLSSVLYGIGKELDAPDAEKKIGHDQYVILKRQFHLMQIKTYVFLHKLRKNCNENQDVILFYFSRNSTESKEQGLVLDEIVKNYGSVVLAVEYNYSKELNFVEDAYNITSAPALVVNYDHVKRGFANYSEVSALIGR